jgi:hypothetical protein
LFDNFFFREIQTQFLNCLFKLTSSCPSKNYFPQSFPDLNSHFFSWVAFFQNKVLTISLQSLTNFNKLHFAMFSLFYRSPKPACLTAYSNSHQAVLPKTTSYNLCHISTPIFFMGISLEKNEKFVNLLEIFFEGPMSPLRKFILYNLFTILIKF